MYIYDISRPDFPQYLSKTIHITSCDPVVAYGNYAYVTLNSTLSRMCTRGSDELQIYDISNPQRPTEVFVDRSMTSPRGLGVDGVAARLFVCDNGLKVYDITDPEAPLWIDDLTDIPEANGIDTCDVIPLNGHLLLIGSDGLYQFDYTGDKLAFISKIDLRK